MRSSKAHPTTSRESGSPAAGSLVLDAEARQRRSAASLVQLLDAATDGVLIHRDLRYVYANRAALDLLGRKRDEVIGHSPFELVPPRFRLFLAERIMQAYTTHAPMPEVEERLLHASGAEIPVEVVTIPVVFGGELATLVHIRNITARRELEVRLRASDRLASAGFVAAGVVHEIGHPLDHAVANLDSLERRLEREHGRPSDETCNLLAAVRNAITRARHVASDLQVFTGAEKNRPENVDVHHVMESTLAFMGPEIRSRASVVRRYGDIPKVRGNQSRLAQVFLNLFNNALQAMSRREHSANELTITTYAKGEALVVVEIRDTGIGIPTELQSSIFEPLLTTRAEGSGLGLALCKELITTEGGELAVESVAAGTKVTVSLRATARETDHFGRRTPEHASGKRILVVDADPNHRSLLQALLSDHTVTIAQTGHEALQRLHAGESYDVIVCDLLVENIDGVDMYRRVEQEWPHLVSRMIFLTGEAFISRTQEFVATIPNRHLQKPFEPNALLDMVDDVVATFA
ncbi:MAG TPA: ATP-binding protein [Labilithrix sp.]|nr:ATP-binding protein [Labilithrix sp.]